MNAGTIAKRTLFYLATIVAYPLVCVMLTALFMMLFPDQYRFIESFVIGSAGVAALNILIAKQIWGDKFWRALLANIVLIGICLVLQKAEVGIWSLYAPFIAVL